jgi:hypothetical protein
MSESKSTLPQLFIIESLGLGDERKERFEGRVLKHISGPRRKRVDVLLHPDETRTRKGWWRSSRKAAFVTSIFHVMGILSRWLSRSPHHLPGTWPNPQTAP